MSRRRPAHRAATLLELLVVIVIISVILIFLWPMVSGSRDSGQRTTCNSHFRQVGFALQMYLQDYDDRLPPAAAGSMARPTTLPALLHPYLKNGEVWRCARRDDPDYEFDGKAGDTTVDVGYNWLALAPEGEGRLLREVDNPALTVAFAETSSYLAVPAPLAGGLGATAPAARHRGMVTVGWLDGHVKWMKPAVLDETPPEEGGVALQTGIDGFRYWNRK